MRVLVAEDDPAICIPMAQFLREQGYDVVEVYHPRQAEQALLDSKEDEHPFDVVVLDLIMPANNPNGGREVLTFMKDIDTPVILATAYGYDGPADRVRNDFPMVKKVLTKTFPLGDLLKAIEIVVSGAIEDRGHKRIGRARATPRRTTKRIG